MSIGRPPLPIGTWGEVSVTQAAAGKYRASAYFRDFDGVTRRVVRSGPTKGRARNALTTALAERTATAGDEITASTRLSLVAEVWHAENLARQAGDSLAINTVRRYREVLDDHVLPGVGALQIREATVTRLDAFLKAVTKNTGAPTAKLCRTVLSGTMGLAVRHGAAATNPVRDVAGITVSKPEPRALTLDEVAALRRSVMRWQSGLPIVETDEPVKPRRGRPPTSDLLDVVDVLLGTGARIGEVLALRWEDVELEPTAASILIAGTVVRDPESGKMVRQTMPKSATSRRSLLIPRFVADALMRRRVAVVVPNVHDLVFPSTAGTVRDPGAVRKQWNKIREEAGFAWVTPHTFRKTVATLLDSEADLRTAAAQLGHAGTDVTARHYVQRTHEGPDSRDLLDTLVPRSTS